ncbi:uncharacterized protein SCHCODRAFT_02632813 [Schizophyllum commune H4-8]|uniref:Uncharacterized protein n=1 Tax=Schizophyllum commune (strain H4-8 / FGSC 9210) TaxID=578458 RepID=D8Q8L9_SCHCM|nr:uncharacterized protein SCHCODRAFT_02632813 [Schizophyllum commune H4-8]KAI5890761.1 hypothetical protein SCHCODRAFT_02632813 [Schizophyllum commune H4-8]
MLDLERRQSIVSDIAASVYDGEISKMKAEASIASAASAAAATITSPIVSIFPVTQTVGGSVEVDVATVTVRPTASGTNAASSSAHHGLDGGKKAGIAVGSAVGAIILALLVLLLWRRKAVRSPEHWRNRAHAWQNLEGKRAVPTQGSSSPYPVDIKKPLDLEIGEVAPHPDLNQAPIFMKVPRRPAPSADVPSHRRSDSGASAVTLTKEVV